MSDLTFCYFLVKQKVKKKLFTSPLSIYTDFKFIIVQIRILLFELYKCCIGINHCNLYFSFGLKYKYNWYYMFFFLDKKEPKNQGLHNALSHNPPLFHSGSRWFLFGSLSFTH